MTPWQHSFKRTAKTNRYMSVWPCGDTVNYETGCVCMSGWVFSSRRRGVFKQGKSDQC